MSSNDWDNRTWGLSLARRSERLLHLLKIDAPHEIVTKEKELVTKAIAGFRETLADDAITADWVEVGGWVSLGSGLVACRRDDDSIRIEHETTRFGVTLPAGQWTTVVQMFGGRS